MRAVITGSAGFIGSTLAERLVAEGWWVTGVDSFSPFYAAADKEANLAGLVGERRFDLVRADVATMPAGPLARRPSAGRAPGRPAGRAGQLRHRLRPVPARQPACHPAPVRGRGRRRLPAGRVRLLLVGVRRRRGVPLLRGRHPDPPPLPVRGDQAGLREARRGLRRHGPADASACGTSPCTARGSARTWRSAGCARPRPAARGSRCAATARRSATSPTSTTRWTRPCGR